MTIQTLIRLSDNTLEVDQLRLYDPTIKDFVFQNGATVTCRVTDTDGNDVLGMSFPAALGYVAGSDGCYTITLEETLELDPMTEYRVIVDAVSGQYVHHWDIPTVAYTDGLTPTYQQLECVVNLPDPCRTV